MAQLGGRVAVSGLGATRASIRVADATGHTVALTTAETDGSWTADVPPGTYVVHVRGLPSFEASTNAGMGTGYTTADTTSTETVDTAGVSAALERRRQARKE